MVRSACLLAALAAVATAGAQAPIVVTRSLPYADTNWSKSLSVPKFDSALGTLTKVTVAFHGGIKSQISLENLNALSRAYRVSSAYNLEIAMPGSASLIVRPAVADVTGTLLKFDGEDDYAGTSGIAYPETSAADDASVTLTDAADLAAFAGSPSDAVAFPVQANAESSIDAAGNFDLQVLNQAAADVTVTYYYAPPAPVLGSLGDRLWFDANANGKQDDGEKGIADQRVQLLSAAGAVLKETVTDADGGYLFDELPAGSYKVQFNKPSGYAYTARYQGATDLDSDVDGGGLTDLVALGAGEDRRDVDAGVVGSLCLGDRVWLDCDKDGLQDSCEPGVKGVPVHLLDAAGHVVADTVTDANGLYKFANLAPGEYSVQFDAPSGYGFTKQFADSRYRQYDSNADVETGKASVILVNSDQTIDAGLVGALKIGDQVWLDCDGDGRFEPEVGERGLPCVTMLLVGDTNGDCWPDTWAYTKTDKDGKYQFLNLKPGNYSVTVLYGLPSNVVPSYDLDGIGSKHIAIGKLTTADRLDFDFGYKPYAPSGCGASHGWWGCNPIRWSCDNLWVGGKCHSKSIVCGWFKKADCGDKSILLYQRLCAAKLNVGDGCNEGVRFTCGKVTCSVKDAIKKCDEWMSRNPVGCKVSGSSANWASVCDYFGILDRFCGGR